MNKTVIVVLLLGLVVAAMAAEASKDKMEKMRIKKEKIMAKKDRMIHDKVKGSRADGLKASKELIAKLQEQRASGAISRDEFLEQVHRLKNEAKLTRASIMSDRKEAARKDAKEGTRNKRSTKNSKMLRKGNKVESRSMKERRSQ